MHYQGECAVPGCGGPGRNYHGDGEIICREHYLYDLAVMRRSQTIRQVREGAMQTKIAYDSLEKCYQLVAANGVELGSYPKRHEAVQAQLALEAPQALVLAQRAAARYPVLAGRALRAAQLLAAGKVHLNGSTEASTPIGSTSRLSLTKSELAEVSAEVTTCHRVESQGGTGEYQVERVDGTWRCTCPDWQARIAGEPFGAPWVGRGPKCKHILAVLMALKCAQEQRCKRAEERECEDLSPAPRLPSSPARSLWDQQQAIALTSAHTRP